MYNYDVMIIQHEKLPIETYNKFDENKNNEIDLAHDDCNSSSAV